MACRCEYIAMCRADKQRLDKALNLTVSVLTQNALIQDQLDSLTSHSPEAYTTENIDEICAAINRLNDDIEPAASSLFAEIRNKQAELEGILERALEEDMRFHAQQG